MTHQKESGKINIYTTIKTCLGFLKPLREFAVDEHQDFLWENQNAAALPIFVKSRSYK